MSSLKSFGESMGNPHLEVGDWQKASNLRRKENSQTAKNRPLIRSPPFVSCCSKCLADESTFKSKRKTLLRCSACQLTRYCSKQCQKQHFSIHKSSCKKISDLMVDIELEVQKLSSYHLFQEKVGEFARYRRCQPFIQAKDMLGNAIVSLAYISYDTPERRAEMLDIALNHFMDILRLNGPTHWNREASEVSPYNSLWDRIVLLLVLLNRDDDAVAMIEYFCKFGLDIECHKHNARNSSRDDWIYPHSSRYKGAIEIGTLIEDEGENHVGSSGLISTGGLEETSRISFQTPVLTICLLIVKLRALVENKVETKHWKAFEITSGGVHLDQIHCVVREFLLGDENLIRQQEQDAKMTLSLIRNTMPGVMEELLDTSQLSIHGATCSFFDGIAQPEFWYLLHDSLQLSPGIVDMIFDIYDHN